MLIPVLLLFLSGAVNLYWYAKFENRIPVEMAKFAKLHSALQLIDCQSLNKDVVLSIARGNLEDVQSFAKILFYAGCVFIFIGLVNLAVAFRHLKRI
jgi:hypothetical protein